MRVLVLFHIYYEEQVDYYLAKMGNIHSCSWDLVCSGNNLSEEMKAKITTFKADAKFVQTPNVGYDIWPFIYCVKQTELSDYDIVIKLHTKNSDSRMYKFHGVKMDGNGWRDNLVDPMLGSKKRFSNLMRIFQSDPKVGIAYSQRLNFKPRGAMPEDGPMLRSELDRLGIKTATGYFCAGSMFATAAAALEFLKHEEIDEQLFEATGDSHGHSTMAHVYERLIPLAIQSNGYKVKLIAFNRRSAMRFAISGCMSWLFTVDYLAGSSHKCLKIIGLKITL